MPEPGPVRETGVGDDGGKTMHRSMIGAAIALFVALAVVPGPVGAEPGDAERHEHVDARHQLNRSYLDRGVVVVKVPREAHTVRFNHGKFWFHGGVWYRAEGAGYIVIAPPVGLVVEVLPPYYSSILLGGRTYYYANDTYYLYNPSERGFQVVEPPPGIETAAIVPPADSPPTAAGAGPAAAAPEPTDAAAFVYPRNGQSAEQQAKDKYECHRWAADQTGFDPTQNSGGVAPEQAAQRRADHARASAACLDGRGYTVR